MLGQPVKVSSYLEDVMSANPTMGGCSGGPIGGRAVANAPGLFEFSGSYAPDECPAGMLGGAEYYRAYRESELARMAPDVLARSVKSTWDDPFMSIITPEKPAAVSLAGYEVFGPQSFNMTTRNMCMDLRGEAAYAPNLNGDMPVGASVSSYAMGAAMNFEDCQNGCGCNANPAGIQLPGGSGGSAIAGEFGTPFAAEPQAIRAGREQKCSDMCRMTSIGGRERAQCLRSQCGQDRRASWGIDLAGSNDQMEQDCHNAVAASGMDAKQMAEAHGTCARMFRRPGASVAHVHPMSFFTPRQIQPVTVLRPYHM